jgi:hypothetical protein
VDSVNVLSTKKHKTLKLMPITIVPYPEYFSFACISARKYHIQCKTLRYMIST